MRDDVKLTRASYTTAHVGHPDQDTLKTDYNTTTVAHYPAKLRDNLAYRPTAIHKNYSQLPGFGDPPSPRSHFETTSHSLHSAHGMRTPVGTPRHKPLYKEKNEQATVFPEGVCGGRASSSSSYRRSARGDPAPESTAFAMFSSTVHSARKVTPRFVNGGEFRNHSDVPLGKNLADVALAPGLTPMELTTTHRTSLMWPSNALSVRATHPFELPQKNTSTYLTTDMGPPVQLEAPRPYTGGRRTPSFTATVTRPTQPSQTSYRNLAKAGPAHYATTHASQYLSHPNHPLVVPPGKGGVDMTRSVIPLGSVGLSVTPTPQTHSHLAFNGAQPRDGLRVRCPSRGTLGARGGNDRPMLRGPSGRG